MEQANTEDPVRGAIMYETHMAAKEELIDHHPSVPRSYDLIELEIYKDIVEEINKEWKGQLANRNSKLFIKSYYLDKQHYLTSLKKVKLRNLTFIV